LVSSAYTIFTISTPQNADNRQVIGDFGPLTYQQWCKGALNDEQNAAAALTVIDCREA